MSALSPTGQAIMTGFTVASLLIGAISLMNIAWYLQRIAISLEKNATNG